MHVWHSRLRLCEIITTLGVEQAFIYDCGKDGEKSGFSPEVKDFNVET